jgi:Tfp pilus assembly protein FimT
MVTLTVAVVLVALAAPSVRDLIVKSRLRGATDDIVSLLDTARSRAVKLERDINVSVRTDTWCAGANAAVTPGTAGDPVLTAAACNCATSGACLVGTDNAVVTGSNYSNVTLSSPSNTNFLLNGKGGITFNSRFGSLDFGLLPSDLVVTSGRYSTQIAVSPLGQVYVCVPATSPFVSGYPKCS